MNLRQIRKRVQAMTNAQQKKKKQETAQAKQREDLQRDREQLFQIHNQKAAQLAGAVRQLEALEAKVTKTKNQTITLAEEIQEVIGQVSQIDQVLSGKMAMLQPAGQEEEDDSLPDSSSDSNVTPINKNSKSKKRV